MLSIPLNEAVHLLSSAIKSEIALCRPILTLTKRAIQWITSIFSFDSLFCFSATPTTVTSMPAQKQCHQIHRRIRCHRIFCTTNINKHKPLRTKHRTHPTSRPKSSTAATTAPMPRDRLENATSLASFTQQRGIQTCRRLTKIGKISSQLKVPVCRQMTALLHDTR